MDNEATFHYTDKELKAIEILDRYPGNDGAITMIKNEFLVSRDTAENMLDANGLFDLVSAEDVLRYFEERDEE